MIMKTFVTSITLSRVLMSVVLLLITPLTAIFYLVYTYCVVSDIVDGPIARRTKTASNFGAFLDSAADLFFIAIVLIVFIPLLALELWMLYCVALVIVIRLIALGIGYKKFRTLTLLHTYANKGAGLVMACFPIFFGLLGQTAAFLIIFIAACSSAIEELIITIRSKELQRNKKSLFTEG
jgi:CDP-diacylglycerol--glycerol-3-phosphate 3-phosphatidyltransferase